MSRAFGFEPPDALVVVAEAGLQHLQQHKPPERTLIAFVDDRRRAPGQLGKRLDVCYFLRRASHES
ncbi:MAG: hypothetical protein IH820_14430 [Bacteroidetes bacterium]|nr:hypothetical protein [Bacteroidota bacterium]